MLEQAGFDERLVFTDQTIFYLTGKVNKHNTRMVTEHSHLTLEHERDFPKCFAISKKRVYGPFFLKEERSTVKRSSLCC